MIKNVVHPLIFLHFTNLALRHFCFVFLTFKQVLIVFLMIFKLLIGVVFLLVMIWIKWKEIKSLSTILDDKKKKPLNT